MKLLLSIGLAVALLAQTSGGNGTAAGPVFENTGQLVLAFLYVLGTGFNSWMLSRRDKLAADRAAQERAWLVEDRRLADERAERTAERVRLDLERTQDRIAEESRRRAIDLAAKIDANTKVSTDAFKEANAVNVKIAAVGAMRRTDDKRRADDKTE